MFIKIVEIYLDRSEVEGDLRKFITAIAVASSNLEDFKRRLNGLQASKKYIWATRFFAQILEQELKCQ